MEKTHEHSIDHVSFFNVETPNDGHVTQELLKNWTCTNICNSVIGDGPNTVCLLAKMKDKMIKTYLESWRIFLIYQSETKDSEQWSSSIPHEDETSVFWRLIVSWSLDICANFSVSAHVFFNWTLQVWVQKIRKIFRNANAIFRNSNVEEAYATSLKT